MKRLAIVDISSFIFRAFYAIRILNSPDGTPVNAVRGVWSMLAKLIEDYGPTHVFMAKDSKGPNFRDEIYSEYKANRSEPPAELIPQFALISELIDSMNIKSYAHERYEADDVIGSACVQWKDHFDEIYIVSGDKDLMQFVGDNIFMLDTMKDIKYGRKEVYEKMGVWPEQIVDYLSIIGDASDNIPGMKGIGPKGASKLLEEYKTLEVCISNKEKLTGKKIIEAFQTHLDDALLSKKLVSIKTDIHLGIRPDDTKYIFHSNKKLIDYFSRLDFKTVLAKLTQLDQVTTEMIPGNESAIIMDMNQTSFFSDFQNITACQIGDLLDQNKASLIYLFNVFDETDKLNLKIKSLALAFNQEQFYWAESEHQEIFKALITSQLQIIAINSKLEQSYILQQNLSSHCHFFDLTQVHYICNPAINHDFKNISLKLIDQRLPSLNEQGELEKKDHADYLSAMIKLEDQLRRDLEINHLTSIYKEIDGPLIPILSKMENFGILVNPEYLAHLEKEFSFELQEIEKKVEAEIKNQNEDVIINLKSPKQVGHLLFDILKYPIIKRTKTGVSTDSDVLEELVIKELGPIPALILNYREVDKLLSTYIKPLPGLIHLKSKRVHTTFDQHTAATGRLASFGPNLQNIPIRTLNGKKIRKAFVAGPGNVLLSADYSQVELRILAHFSEDPIMVNAFRNDCDIHAETAAEILGIKESEVSDEQRSMAKAVNFGLMYGQSSFGLAASLKISRFDAKNYIAKYFGKFSRIKSYLDSLKEFCETHGYSKTLHGRKRFLPDINSTNRTIKSGAERIAVNSPIQGTAADIVKLAMLSIDAEMLGKNVKSKLLLQVHDELVFEVPEEEIDTVTLLVGKIMENTVKLSVPLKVDISIGANWLDMR